MHEKDIRHRISNENKVAHTEQSRRDMDRAKTEKEVTELPRFRAFGLSKIAHTQCSLRVSHPARTETSTVRSVV